MNTLLVNFVLLLTDVSSRFLRDAVISIRIKVEKLGLDLKIERRTGLGN